MLIKMFEPLGNLTRLPITSNSAEWRASSRSLHLAHNFCTSLDVDATHVSYRQNSSFNRTIVRGNYARIVSEWRSTSYSQRLQHRAAITHSGKEVIDSQCFHRILYGRTLYTLAWQAAHLSVGNGHQSPALWSYPDDRSAEFNDIEHWVDLAILLFAFAFAFPSGSTGESEAKRKPATLTRTTLMNDRCMSLID